MTMSARAGIPPIVIGPVDFSGRPSVKLPMPRAPTDRIPLRGRKTPTATAPSSLSHTIVYFFFGDEGVIGSSPPLSQLRLESRRRACCRILRKVRVQFSM